MKNNHALHTALDVETQHRDMLQAQMAEALIEQEAAVAQLAQLDQYDGETRGQLSQSGARHDAARLAHQQTFLARLQQAIMLQHDAVEQAQRRIDALRAQLVTVNQRIAALQALIQRQALQFNQSKLGATMPVLLDRLGKREGQMQGRSPYMQSVYVEDAVDAREQLVDVRIVGAYANSLKGEIITSSAHEPAGRIHGEARQARSA
ncbi:MAG: TRAM domain-containing protein [Betaproteobacteria bacterium]|nr:TRAM domain-containing protein [Betaproteobacteria bacterium]